MLKNGKGFLSFSTQCPATCFSAPDFSHEQFSSRNLYFCYWSSHSSRQKFNWLAQETEYQQVFQSRLTLTRHRGLSLKFRCSKFAPNRKLVVFCPLYKTPGQQTAGFEALQQTSFKVSSNSENEAIFNWTNRS